MLAQNSSKNKNDSGKKDLVDCIFTAHPSYISIPDEVEGVDVPMSVIVGDADMALKKPQALEMQRLLLDKNAVEGKRDGGRKDKYEMVILEGAKHGFAIRTHPDDEREMEMAMRAEDQALSWFGKWLGEA